MRALLALLALLALTAGGAHARAIVVKKALDASMASKELLANGDLEDVRDGQALELQPWGLGYVLDADARSGQVAAKCAITDVAAGEMGLTYVVPLNQTTPLPFIAELWSKAVDVSGSPDADYSLYVDLTYTDGTPLWGNVIPFSTGTHDWEKRTITVVPEKPIREVQFHGIFRRHTGVAWFDDFSLKALQLPEGTATFDGLPVVAPRPVAEPGFATDEQAFSLGSGISDKVILLDRATGQWRTVSGRVGGLFLRDARRRSDFRQPLGKVTLVNGFPHWEATDEELGLKLTADYRTDPATGAVRVEGVVEDLTGEDRGVSVYAALPVPGAEVWHDDVRNTRTIETGQSYGHYASVGCGANGRMSLYPFGCVTRDGYGFCLGAPLDPPRLFRFAYDEPSGELYAVQDFGLSRDFTHAPGKAPFSFVLYQVTAPGDFRHALDHYYRLFPEYFVKRLKQEGLWVAFDDIAGVQGFQDFGLAFKEGTNNPAFDEAHGILTYTYVEPTSYWMAMGDLPRTLQAAQELFARQLAEKQTRAVATEVSGIRDSDGQLVVAITNAPWCDGALFTNNPDPDIPTTDELPLNQGQLLWKAIRTDLDTPPTIAPGWRFWGDGYEAVPGEGRNGSQGAVCDMPVIGQAHGLSQSVMVDQAAPGKITVSAWSKAEGVTGNPDADYSLYCDIALKNGKTAVLVAPFTPGTHDWERQEVVIDLPAPVLVVYVYGLFRLNHSGKVWFDDFSVRVAGQDREYVLNPGLEPTEDLKVWVDGTYFDSLEMGASMLDFDRRHWGAAQTPLVYTTMEGLPAELLMFASCEFVKDVSQQMHAEGRTAFANSVLLRFPHPAAMLDLMGVETNWYPGGTWRPMTDQECNLKRALCYQRPYLLLQNTDFAAFTPDLVEKYMKRAVFYGMAPSFFSHNAASATYWSRPEIYNRDRHLFKRYVPLHQKLSAAGWEPLTHATTGNPQVWIERYGRGEELYLALFNPTDQPQDYRLAVDLKALKVEANRLHDVLADTDAGASRVGDKLQLIGTLGPEDLRVVKVGR
ncbi:MAG: hypothetical protein HPY69_12565 [Armatimonadetes bacterium]|nr:hypothetical protein [Armatimonadota bacterium]